MKTTLKILTETCQEANSGILKGLSWGLKVNRLPAFYELMRISRKASINSVQLVTGNPKEIAVALHAVITLVTLELERNRPA